MALRPVPLEDLSFPAKVLLLGAGIVFVCTASLVACLFLTGLSPFAQAVASLSSEAGIFALSAGVVLFAFLLGSAVWAFWRQGLKPWGWSGD